MANPFGDEVVGGNPFGDAPAQVQSGNPFGDSPAEATFAGAVGTSILQGGRQAVGGMMQAAGDFIAPESRPLQQVAPDDGSILGRLKNIHQQVKELERLPVEGRKDVTNAVLPDSVQEVGQNLAGAGKELGADAAGKIKEATPADMNLVQEAGVSAAASVGQMLPWLAVGRVAGTRGLVREGAVEAGALGQFGAQSFGQTYQEARAKGAEPEQAFKAALNSGVSEITGEKMALDTLLKRGPGWFKKFLLQEVGGEEYTTIAQSLGEKGYYDPNKWSSAGEILHDLAVTGLAAGMGAGGIKGVDKGLSYFEAKREERKNENSAAETELAKIQAQAAAAMQGLPPEIVEGDVPPPQATSPLTAEEQALAVLQREQLKNGLAVEPTAEGASYGEQLRGMLAGMGLGQGHQTPMEDIAGMTPEVLERRARTAEIAKNPIDLQPITISGTDQGVLGLTLRQTGELPKGTVIAVGENEDLFPAEVYAPLVQSLQEWVAKYMPEAKIVLNLEQLPGEEFGAHGATFSKKTGEWTHVITPRELPSFKYQTGNVKTKMEMMTALTHEFGHALKVQNFFQGFGAMAPEMLEGLQVQMRAGQVSPELVQAAIAMAPEEGKLLARWQELRNQVLEGKMTATEFVEQWVGTRKLGDSVHPWKAGRNKDLYSWANTMLGKSGKNLTGATALELVEAAYGDPAYALNFDEFMAEQFSRAAYTNGDLEGSPIGKFFAQTLQQLRNLFRDLKTWKGENGERMVAPDETFQSWLDKQSLRASTMEKPEGKFKLSAKVKKAQKEVLAKAGLTPTGKPSRKKASPKEQVPVTKEELGLQVDPKRDLEDMVYGLNSSGAISDKQMDRYLDKIQRGELVAVRESLQRLLGDAANYDREYSSKVFSRLPDKQKILAETLMATVAMQDVKEGERRMWTAFLQEHPQGFTMDEAAEALAAGILPLEYSLHSDFATYGTHVLDKIPGEWWENGENYSRVWKNTDIEVSSVATRHFRVPGYLMHSRFMDIQRDRYVLELQSDFFQENATAQGALPADLEGLDDLKAEVGYQTDILTYYKELIADGDVEQLAYEWDMTRHVWGRLYHFQDFTTAENLIEQLPALQKIAEESEAKLEQLQQLRTQWLKEEGKLLGKVEDLRKDWWQRLIKEEVAQAVEDSKIDLYFPTADTLAEIESWEKIPVEGVRVPLDTPVELSRGGMVTAVYRSGNDVVYVLEDGTIDVMDNPLTDEGSSIIQKALNRMPADYGQHQGIYDRYRRDITKYLKKNYNAVEVASGEKTWLRVDLVDKTNVVMNWDRENPVQPQAPQWTLEAFAGMTAEQYREPGTVAEAAGMWKRLGFESPFFKRWFGASQIRELDGLPLRVYRGAGGKITFLNLGGRGGLTGAQSGKKAFWFSDNHANAQWYANQATQRGYAPLEPEARRKMGLLQKQAGEAESLLGELAQEGGQRQVIQKRLERLRKEMRALEEDGKANRIASPTVQGFYLKMENPMVVDMQGEPYDDKEYSQLLDLAQRQGYDGVVFKNTYDPLVGNMYALFEPENAKVSSNVGTFDPTDELHWDSESKGQQAAKVASKMLQKYWGKAKLQAGNTYAKMVDSMLQLQQVAASQPDDFNLQTFMRKLGMAERLKNNLQMPAEELVKEMGQLIGSSPERIRVLHKALKAEWKSGNLQTTIKGYDVEGNEVWGEEVGMGLENQAQVHVWRTQDTVQLRAFLKAQGVDVETEEGKHVLDLYLKTRDLFLFQFNELGNTLRRRAGRTYANAPALQKQELIAINGVMSKLLMSPFVPQGNFGNHVLVVKQKQLVNGQNRFQVVFKRHYENKADFDQAYLEAKKRTLGMLDMQVTSQVLEEQAGIPMQLPSDLLERLANLGEFEDGQLETLADVMTTSRYSRISERFENISKQVEGGNEDFVRVLADFGWRNANYIWKTHYRYELQQSISASKHLVRRIEKNPMEQVGEGKQKVDRLRRNIGLMQNSLNYIINPPSELQGMRGFITLVYLAYNVKTALMNLSTTVNTWAAVTSEYGEIAGNKEWLRSLKQTGELLLYKSRRNKALAEGKDAPTVEDAEMNELIGVLDQAAKDGVIDQSYAYFLAAHANSSPLLAATGGKMSQVGHAISELGMMPFQATEKVNRIHSMLTFYKLEKKAGSQGREAYQRAVEKTNLLQNAYDQANRPDLFRGKKAILTMFMSYTQFMGWITTGGYERAANVQAKQLGRETAPKWRGTTAKIWLVYLMLGGLMGVPFARNLMDVVQWLWRKLGFGDAEVELRKFLDHMGLDSNFAMHGLLHDMGGFDLSGSFGLGRMLPGTDLLVKEKPMTALETMGSLLTAASGPAGSFYKSVLEAVGHLKGGEVVEAGKSMPGALGAVSKALDAKLRQDLKPTYGVTTKDGRRMTWDAETEEFRDITTKELAGMALGFNPTILAENREQNFAVMSEVFYWQTRRSDMMDRYWQAVRSGDQELRLEVLAAKDKYNAQVPQAKLRITGKDLADSVRTHRKQVRAGENYGASQKKYRGVAQDVQGAYMEGGE